MKRIEFTVLIRHGTDHVGVDNVCDDLLDFVRSLDPRFVSDISVDIFQNVEED